MGNTLMCLAKMDVLACKQELEATAKETFEDEKDVADIVLYGRQTINRSSAKYLFSLKVAHDDIKSQSLYEKFMSKYKKDNKFYLTKTNVIVENGTLKEVFVFEVTAKA